MYSKGVTVIASYITKAGIEAGEYRAASRFSHLFRQAVPLFVFGGGEAVLVGFKALGVRCSAFVPVGRTAVL